MAPFDVVVSQDDRQSLGTTADDGGRRRIQDSRVRVHSDADGRRQLSRTATPAINRGTCWHSAGLSEFKSQFLNGVQRAVNRKVQGSNPWSGAKSEFILTSAQQASAGPYILCTSFSAEAGGGTSGRASEHLARVVYLCSRYVSASLR